jgi:hypothetical protein
MVILKPNFRMGINIFVTMVMYPPLTKFIGAIGPFSGLVFVADWANIFLLNVKSAIFALVAIIYDIVLLMF